MFALLSRAPMAAQSKEPSPLLSHLAGEFAGRIASLWPTPHAVFLTAPAARRHLVCLSLVFRDDIGCRRADRLLHASLKRAIRQALADPPAGLTRALGRLGEAAWSAEGYRHLVALLREPPASKVLRHLEQITPARARALALLPAPLLGVGLGRLELSPAQAAVIGEAFAVLTDRAGPDVSSAPLRWSGATTPKALLEAIREELQPPVPPAPLPGSARMVPLTTRAAIRDAALRYRNCLRRQGDNAAGGWSAFYEWTGKPGAIVEIYRDTLFG